LGNLGFESINRRLILKKRGIRSLLAEFALSYPENESMELIKKYATRALAIFGENEIVRQAVNRRPIVGKGIRILCMDGGGMRGISTVQMLRRIEVRVLFFLMRFFVVVLSLVKVFQHESILTISLLVLGGHW
jgi:hypothetical protein